jgi:hypothetical protein
MIQLTSDDDVIMAQRFGALDPFQAALPCWKSSVLPLLPYEPINMRPTKEQTFRKDIETIMAIKFVQESEAPQRLHGRGTISTSQEYADALNAVRAIKPGQAIIVTIESQEILKLGKKGDVAFTYAVRRYLAKNGVMATAYVSNPKEIVIRRAIAPPKTGVKQKK